MDIKIIKIDPNDPDHVEKVNRIATYSFHKSPSETEVEKRLDRAHYRSLTRQYLLFEDEEAVASASVHPLTQNLRGKIVNLGGVATVGTLPPARRKGYVGNLVKHLFSEMKEGDQVVSSLHPFDVGYYQQFGYVTLPLRFAVKFSPSSLREIRKIDLRGETTLTELSKNVSGYLEFIDKIQPLKPGMIRFADERYEDFANDELWLVQIIDDNKEVIGVMTYTISGYLEELQVKSMEYIPASQAKYLLLEYFYKHLGQIEQIKLPVRYTDNVERWLNNIDISMETQSGAMVRIIDLIGLNGKGLKTSMDNASLVIQVRDEFCVWNNGVFEIRTDQGIFGVQPSFENPSGTIDIRGLSSLLYGYYDIFEMESKNWIEYHSENENEIDLIRVNLEKIFSYHPHEITTYF